jgi:hypothetical protein
MGAGKGNGQARHLPPPPLFILEKNKKLMQKIIFK